MWVAEFDAWHESRLLRSTEGLNVTIVSYYLNTFTEHGKRFVSKVMVADGPDAKESLRRMAQDKRIRIIDVEGNQMFYQLPELDGFHNLLTDRSVFFIRPIVVKDGKERWIVASHDKKVLLNFYKRVKKLKFKAKIELLNIRREKLNFFTSDALSGLTSHQLNAITTASEYGYYSYPRKTSVKKLAGALKVPRTTLTEHLRKAEVKVLNRVLNASQAR